MNNQSPPRIEFRPATKTSQDDFDVMINDHAMGTFKWHRHPKFGKTAEIHGLNGEVGIVPNESAAVNLIIKWYKELLNVNN